MAQISCFLFSFQAKCEHATAAPRSPALRLRAAFTENSYKYLLKKMARYGKVEP